MGKPKTRIIRNEFVLHASPHPTASWRGDARPPNCYRKLKKAGEAYDSGVAGGSSGPFGSESGLAGASGGGAALGQVGGAAGAARRIDMRVMAKTAASASATSPTTCAANVEVPD